MPYAIGDSGGVDFLWIIEKQKMLWYNKTEYLTFFYKGDK